MVNIEGVITKQKLIQLLSEYEEIDGVNIQLKSEHKAKDEVITLQDCIDKCQKVKNQCLKNDSCENCQYANFVYCSNLGFMSGCNADPHQWTEDDVQKVAKELFNSMKNQII